MREIRDRYLGFTYNGKSMNMTAEADFYGFIENSGNELSFFNTPEFTNEFVVPQFGEKTIYTGNTKSNRTFSLKVQLDKINLEKYRRFLEWLSPDSEGVLSFDYDKRYGYDVKVQSISPSEFHVTKKRNNNEDFYYVDMSIEFVTVRDFAARWIKKDAFWDSTDPTNFDHTIDNHYFESFIELLPTSNFYKIYNFHNLKNYFTIEFNNTLQIKKDNVVLVNITGAGNGAKYFSEFGVALKSDGTFLQCGPNPNITIKANENIELEITGGVWKIIPSSREVL